jgi:hypothetical protein
MMMSSPVWVAPPPLLPPQAKAMMDTAAARADFLIPITPAKAWSLFYPGL